MKITIDSSDSLRQPIGFFDSGIGGISVLAEATHVLPQENYLYYADSKNAPYGEKSKEEILDLTVRAVEKLMAARVKAVVVACNTATSASIRFLRANYPLPFIGMEPALKPAVEDFPSGDILVLATPLTLREEKFRTMAADYLTNGRIEVLPCPGLAEAIEKSFANPLQIMPRLQAILGRRQKASYAAVVLGCTHYVLVKEQILDLCQAQVAIDGNRGTVRQLKRILKLENLLQPRQDTPAQVRVLSSCGEEQACGCRLLLHRLQNKTSCGA